MAIGTDEEDFCRYKYKMVVLGDANAGKTSLVIRYVRDFFSDAMQPTIGAQFMHKKLTAETSLDIWDTAGQERYRSLLPMYVKGANILILVISVEYTDDQILEQVNYWLNYIHEKLDIKMGFKTVLVFNKLDLYPDFKVPDEVNRLSSEFYKIMIVSSKTSKNIDTFKSTIMDIAYDFKCQKQEEREKKSSFIIDSYFKSTTNSFKFNCSII